MTLFMGKKAKQEELYLICTSFIFFSNCVTGEHYNDHANSLCKLNLLRNHARALYYKYHWKLLNMLFKFFFDERFCA